MVFRRSLFMERVTLIEHPKNEAEGDPTFRLTRSIILHSFSSRSRFVSSRLIDNHRPARVVRCVRTLAPLCIQCAPVKFVFRSPRAVVGRKSRRLRSRRVTVSSFHAVCRAAIKPVLMTLFVVECREDSDTRRRTLSQLRAAWSALLLAARPSSCRNSRN